MSKLPARQVHLDFHTSRHIPDIGRDFDRAQWQAALQAGRVNLINVFAKGHHGWSYYPTEVGEPHPHLARNLLGEQIDACHEIGVRAPIYYTVGWSVQDAEAHPEWCVRDQDGTVRTTNIDPEAAPDDPRPTCSWTFLCPSGGYLELMLDQTREICETFDVDGFWYDITNGPVCWCDTCRAAMREAGLDPDDPDDAAKHNVAKWKHFMSECDRIIHERHPDASLYFNGTMQMYEPWMHEPMTQYDLEDLPTTWGGYDKFPLRGRYFIEKGKPFLAMSGKFHTMWGEFGGFKHPDAIRFEAACMIAYGARCNFGDQLHPVGRMDMDTYRNIGAAFEYVERIEKFGLDAAPASRLGVWLSGPDQGWAKGVADCDQGVANMLLETQIDFRVIGEWEPDLSQFDAIILTGYNRLSPARAEALRSFVADGGKVVALGTSGMDESGERFALDVGAKFVGPPNYGDDYLVVGGKLGEGLVDSPFLCYDAAVRVEPTDGEVLAAIREPYFDRTYATFCSHQNTPYRLEDAAHAGAVRKGGVIYFPHQLGEMYHRHGARLHRDLFINALRMLYPAGVLEVDLPSAGRATICHQPDRGRYVAHLMYGPPLQRGRCLVIEDLVPLADVPVTLRVEQDVRKARLAPDGEPLELQADGDAVRVVVPRVQCHQAIVFEY